MQVLPSVLSLFALSLINEQECLTIHSIVSIRPLVNSVLQKNNFLISQSKHILWMLKRTVFRDGSFEHSKHMLKLLGKKVFTILNL